DDELSQLLTGYGYTPYFVEGREPAALHQLMAATLDEVVDEIHAIQHDARARRSTGRPAWPLIVLRTPKGWTGPKEVDGKPVEDTWRAHQVPHTDLAKKPGHQKMLEDWMKSYRPQELFDERGTPARAIVELGPRGDLRMGASQYATGGILLRDLDLPDFRTYAIDVPKPGAITAESTRVQGHFIRDVMKRNMSTFRVFSPDETASNRWDSLFDVTDR